MKADEFIKQVMHRAGIGSRTAADHAVRATLETLSEHLTPGETSKFSAQLPAEFAVYMHQLYIGGLAERFSLDDFFLRVSRREGVSREEAVQHARVVAGLLSEVVTVGQIEHLRAQLPPGLAQLFNVQNEGDLPPLA